MALTYGKLRKKARCPKRKGRDVLTQFNSTRNYLAKNLGYLQNMNIDKIVKSLSSEAKNDTELAIKLHNHVRDHVSFGFTHHFDRADTNYTLRRRVGHCNPKSELLTRLFNCAGFESSQHFILIKKELLHRCLPAPMYVLLPSVISHSLTDVSLESKWHSLDSYVLDPPLFYSLQKQLIYSKSKVGFGTHLNATCTWDGKSSAFSQAGDKSIWIADHGRVKDVDDYYKSSSNKNKVAGVQISHLLKTIGPLGFVWEEIVNQEIVRFRSFGASHDKSDNSKQVLKP